MNRVWLPEALLPRPVYSTRGGAMTAPAPAPRTPVEAARERLVALRSRREDIEEQLRRLREETVVAVREASAAGIGPMELHRLSGLSRPTVNGYLTAEVSA